jgi:hypothetical protein
VLSAVLLLAASAAAAVPDCAALAPRWPVYHMFLGAQWPYRALDCATPEDRLGDDARRDLWVAKAAALLEDTRLWTDRSLPSPPLVPGGTVQAPPDMLLWLGRRVRRVYVDAAGDPHGGGGELHLTRADFAPPVPVPGLGFTTDPAVSVASQMVHEAKHSALFGWRTDGHALCTVPGMGGYNCDETVAEDFTGGGSHATAALWLAWIARRTALPQDSRLTAEWIAVEIVLKTRINDAAAAHDFACRWFGYAVREDRPCAAP